MDRNVWNDCTPAMYYKLPVIVPTVGGIAEIVENGYNGFHLDYRSLNEMQVKLKSW